MQLIETGRQRQLSLAVLGLLGAAGAPVRAADDPLPTQFDSGLLYYQEGDSRVKDLEAVINVRQPLAADRAWSGRILLDSVCGGSPNGAIPSRNQQTFATPSSTSLTPTTTVVQTTTSASGGGGGGGGSINLCNNPVVGGVYTVAPGQLPIDQSFHDQRIAVSGGYETALASNTKLGLGAAYSHEFDFASTSFNASIAQDFDAHNTTLSLGVNVEGDFVHAVGGTPVPWSQYNLFEKGGSQRKRVHDLLLGLTQVMNRRWLAQWNVSLERASGYLNDPYKIVTEVDAQGNDAAGAYVYENRPGSRNRTVLYWDNKVDLDYAVAQLSWRHQTDSWHIRSDTFDLHLRVPLGEAGYIEPHWRGYRQSAADFFHFFLFQGAPASGFASADPRLAGFTGRTVGLKYGLPMGKSGEFSVRVERYVQHGSSPANVPAGLQGLDLLPDLRASIVQAGLRFEF